jgi:hypothetical protein
LYAWPLATPRVVVGMESERRGVDREAMVG